MLSQHSSTKRVEGWICKCARLVIKFLGWKINNMTHPLAWAKAVVVLAPHTSNWDFFYGMLFKLTHPNLPIKFAIKKEVMFFPLSYLMKVLGAIPIDRTQTTKATDAVSIMSAMLHQAGNVLLVIAPEGTRKYVKRWKTGFYRVAQAADVPVILGYINYSKKEMGLGPSFHITSDMAKDIITIQDFYKKIPGKYPSQGVV